MIHFTQNVAQNIAIVVLLVDIGAYWFYRLWLTLLNALIGITVAVLSFVNDLPWGTSLMCCAVAACAIVTFMLADGDEHEDAFNVEDYTDAPRPGGADES